MCFQEVHLLAQKGSSIEKYKVVDDGLIMTEETWMQSSSEEENDGIDEGENLNLNQSDQELSENSIVSDSENLNQPQKHSNILISLRQLKIPESSVQDILKSNFTCEILDKIIEILKTWSGESSIKNIRIFTAENKTYLLSLCMEEYESLEIAIGTVLEKYDYQSFHQLSPENMQIAVNCLEKKIVIYNAIDNEIDEHCPTNVESESALSIRLFQSFEAINFVDKYIQLK
jgi:hypothetical protein